MRDRPRHARAREPGYILWPLIYASVFITGAIAGFLFVRWLLLV